MIIKDKVDPRLEKVLKELHGRCRLELLEGDTVVDSIEFDNTVTPFVSEAINKGNFMNQMPTSVMFQLKKWFYGVQLLSKNGDATKLSIPNDADVIAVADNASGSESTDLRRGNFNQESSSVLIDENNKVVGYKFVWYWSDTRGNCGEDQKIKAVCLTRGPLAIARYGDTMPDGSEYLTSIFNTITIAPTLAQCQIIDYDGETAYRIDIVNGNIKVEKFQLDTFEFSVEGVFNSSNQFDVTAKIAEETLIPTVAIASPTNKQRASVSFKRGKLHVFTWANQALIDHEIDTSDADPSEWTINSTGHTFSLGTGVNIKDVGSANRVTDLMGKDAVLLTFENNTSYLTLVGTDNKFYKCNLTNDADIINLNGTLADTSYNGFFVELDNGDWIKYPYGHDNVTYLSVNYYHAGVVYVGKEYYNAPSGWGYRALAINNTGHGVVLYSMPNNGRNGDVYYMALGFPAGSISTVWNIDDDTHIKSAGMTMRVIYEITESNS